MWTLAVSRIVMASALAVATYWQTGRCAENDLGGGAALITRVESVVLTERGPLELHVSWTSSGLSGKRLDKGSDSGNRRMYLQDSGGKRYDHVETRGAAREGGRLDDYHPLLRGVFVFPPPAPEAASFVFRDDDQKIEIANVALSPKLRTDIATSASIPERLNASQTIRVDYRSGDERDGYLLRRTEGGFLAEAVGEKSTLATLPGAPLPAAVMDAFFQALTESPLLRKVYEPTLVRSQDVSAVTLDLRRGNEDVFFFSRPQGDRHLPWTVQAARVNYVVPDDTPLRALEILEPFFGLDPQSRAMMLLSPSLGDERSAELWAKLEAHAGAEKALGDSGIFWTVK